MNVLVALMVGLVCFALLFALVEALARTESKA